MADLFAPWLLTIVIFLPAGGALLLMAMPARSEDLIRRSAITASLATLVFAVAAMTLFFELPNEDRVDLVHRTGEYGLVTDILWIGGEGPLSRVEVRYKIGLDAISLWLVLLTVALTPLAIWASFAGIRKNVREYYALLLLLETGMVGVFCAMDLILFYIFFEFTLIPLYFIIGHWGTGERLRAANKFFIYTVAGSVLTFAGILAIAYKAYLADGVFSFDLERLYALAAEGQLSPSFQKWLFLAFAAGFAVKVPFFPLHTWLPLAHTEAPTAGSVILAGVLLKLGTYGFLRFSLPMLPDATMRFAPLAAGVAIAGIIYGALVAWAQTDIKKLVAYSSVSHLGFCMLGMFSLTIAGLSGSVVYMINHGLSTGALFILVGMLYERYHTREFHGVGGLARPMPWFAFFLIFFTLSSIGLPGLNGFVGEFLVLVGTVVSTDHTGHLGFGYAVVAATGIVLGAVYMLYMAGRVLFGPLVEPAGTPDTSTGLTRDLTRREIGVLAPIAALCVWIGVYPSHLLSSLQPALERQIVARVFNIEPGSLQPYHQPRFAAGGGKTGESQPARGPTDDRIGGASPQDVSSAGEHSPDAARAAAISDAMPLALGVRGP